jgi:flagellar protein FliO/FliZ
MLSWLLLLLMLTVVAIAGYCAYRIYVVGDASFKPNMWFAPRPEPRLGVSELANIDGRRKLVLVRRDDVEHLLMIGGPVDLIVEEKIRLTEAAARVKTPAEASTPVFTRQPRSFGQAVNE